MATKIYAQSSVLVFLQQPAVWQFHRKKIKIISVVDLSVVLWVWDAFHWFYIDNMMY